MCNAQQQCTAHTFNLFQTCDLDHKYKEYVLCNMFYPEISAHGKFPKQKTVQALLDSTKQVLLLTALVYLVTVYIHLPCVYSTGLLEWHLIAAQCNVKNMTAV